MRPLRPVREWSHVLQDAVALCSHGLAGRSQGTAATIRPRIMAKRRAKRSVPGGPSAPQLQVLKGVAKCRWSGRERQCLSQLAPNVEARAGTLLRRVSVALMCGFLMDHSTVTLASCGVLSTWAFDLSGRVPRRRRREVAGTRIEAKSRRLGIDCYYCIQELSRSHWMAPSLENGQAQFRD